MSSQEQQQNTGVYYLFSLWMDQTLDAQFEAEMNRFLQPLISFSGLLQLGIRINCCYRQVSSPPISCRYSKTLAVEIFIVEQVLEP